MNKWHRSLRRTLELQIVVQLTSIYNLSLKFITQIMPEESIRHIDFDELNIKAISQPLVKHIYTADPSAHVFDGKIYIYPSHDIDTGIAFDDLGSHFAMEDYHVLSMESPDASARDEGVALHVKDIPW